MSHTHGIELDTCIMLWLSWGSTYEAHIYYLGYTNLKILLAIMYCALEDFSDQMYLHLCPNEMITEDGPKLRYYGMSN